MFMLVPQDLYYFADFKKILMIIFLLLLNFVSK